MSFMTIGSLINLVVGWFGFVGVKILVTIRNPMKSIPKRDFVMGVLWWKCKCVKALLQNLHSENSFWNGNFRIENVSVCGNLPKFGFYKGVFEIKSKISCIFCSKLWVLKKCYFRASISEWIFQNEIKGKLWNWSELQVLKKVISEWSF